MNWKAFTIPGAVYFYCLVSLARFSKFYRFLSAPATGYKAPTIFWADRSAKYRKVQALDDQESEKSFGPNGRFKLQETGNKKRFQSTSINCSLYKHRRPLVLQEKTVPGIIIHKMLVRLLTALIWKQTPAYLQREPENFYRLYLHERKGFLPPRQ